MTTVGENGKQRDVRLTPSARMRASGPILILAGLFVLAVLLSWYFSWFGRGLSDADISEYLNDEKHPRHVQHALLQIQQRMEIKDSTVHQWYPRIVALSQNSETEFRLTVAWLMGSDNSSEEFHQALLKLVNDPEPMVRRNAALALVRFHDGSGRPELLAILEPYVLRSPLQGVIVSTLKQGSPLTRGTLLARIQTSDKTINEIRSPVPGKIDRITANAGTNVSLDDPVTTISPDEESVWEALRGLALTANSDDVKRIEPYTRADSGVSDKIREQAGLTVQAIQARGGKK